MTVPRLNNRILATLILIINLVIAIWFSVASGFRLGTSLAFAGVITMCIGAILTYQHGVVSNRWNASLNPLMPEIDLREIEIEHRRMEGRREANANTKIDLIKLGAIPFFVGIGMLILL